MSQDNIQQLLLFSYIFVHVLVNILIRVIKQNQTNCFYEKNGDRGNPIVTTACRLLRPQLRKALPA
jgi:hypothetical protein